MLKSLPVLHLIKNVKENESSFITTGLIIQ